MDLYNLLISGRINIAGVVQCRLPKHMSARVAIPHKHNGSTINKVRPNNVKQTTLKHEHELQESCAEVAERAEDRDG